MAENPAGVEKFVLADSGGFGSRPPRSALLGMFWLYSLPSMRALRWYSKYVVHKPGSISEDLGAYAVEVIRMPGGKRAFQQGRGRAIDPIPEEMMARVTQPTLILWGKEERFFPLEDMYKASRLLSDSRSVVLPEAGHLSFLDQPGLFSDEVLDFLLESANQVMGS